MSNGIKCPVTSRKKHDKMHSPKGSKKSPKGLMEGGAKSEDYGVRHQGEKVGPQHSQQEGTDATGEGLAWAKVGASLIGGPRPSTWSA